MPEKFERFELSADDGARLAACRMLPAGKPRALIQIAHGMAEHALRYERLARSLAAAGYAVYAQDHRGHGASAAVHGLGNFGPRGFAAVIDDMAALSRRARSERPGAPLVLLGHSMGSFASQAYLLHHHADLAGLVLSGTAAGDLLAADLAASGVAGLEAFNAGFEPARTPFDWLSRDPVEVDAYVADPLCGFELTEASARSVFELTAAVTFDSRMAALPASLPVLVISGEVDPVVGPGQKFSRALVARYREAGMADVEHRIYPGARHELFNETNRDEVIADLLAWLARVVGD